MPKFLAHIGPQNFSIGSYKINFTFYFVCVTQILKYLGYELKPNLRFHGPVSNVLKILTTILQNPVYIFIWQFCIIFVVTAVVCLFYLVYFFLFLGWEEPAFDKLSMAKFGELYLFFSNLLSIYKNYVIYNFPWQ